MLCSGLERDETALVKATLPPLAPRSTNATLPQLPKLTSLVPWPITAVSGRRRALAGKQFIILCIRFALCSPRIVGRGEGGLYFR